MQAARYTKSDRFAFRGLFSGMLFGFVLVQFACSALEEYFSFFVRSQWHTPMWGEDMSSPKRLTALPGAKLEPYELSQPLLSVLLFNWVSRSDLRVPPDNCQVSSAYARFSMGAKPGQPLVGQLFSVFKVDLAIQIVYTFYNTFSDYIQPYLMQRVLRFIDEYLEDSSLGLRFGYFLAAMMLAASVVGTVVEQQQQWQSRGISMEIRNVLVASLTQKTLRRRAHESKSKGDSSRDSSDGRVYNILTADVNRVNKLPEMFGSVLF
ncbi:Transporter of the ATP-binding cassette (ABC), partial [Linderina pennispora]